MIKRLILAVVVAVLVFLVCLLAGALLVLLGGLFPPAFGAFFVLIGDFLIKWAVAIGAIFGVLAFLSGRTALGFWPWRV